MDYHRLMCKIKEAEGCWDEAKLSALRAVATSITHFGADSYWAVNTLIAYRKVLEAMGENEQAQRVAQDRDLIVAKLCRRPPSPAANIFNYEEQDMNVIICEHEERSGSAC